MCSRFPALGRRRRHYRSVRRTSAEVFDRHRDDLKESHALTVKSLQDTILILVDQVEHLRAQLDGRPHVSAARPAANPTQQQPAAPGVTPYLSEEEEDLLALHLGGHISDQELADLTSAFARQPSLESDS